MDIQPASRFPKTTVDKLLSAISFYQQVKARDPVQYGVLMSASRIETFQTGDKVIEQGSKNPWLYFLVRGQLDVIADEHGPEMGYIVNQITPGEVFGGLASLLGTPRTATVTVAPNTREAVVFGTNFSIFGELQDVSYVSFDTKLLYYQNLVHSLRWQLESNRIHFPQHSLAESHHKIKLYLGKRGTWEELESLEAQGKALGQLVVDWNGVLPALLAKERLAEPRAAAVEHVHHAESAAHFPAGLKQVYI